MRLGKLALISVLGGVLVASTALAAPGKLLKKSSDDGTPQAFAKARAINPKAILVRTKASPNGQVEVIWDTSCARGAKGKVREGDYTEGGKKLHKLKKAFKRPDDCLINVLAAYETASTEGKITIEIFARRR
jgi:hypothetical protein